MLRNKVWTARPVVAKSQSAPQQSVSSLIKTGIYTAMAQEKSNPTSLAQAGKSW